MKYTNRHGLPQPIVAALTNDGYTKGAADISVTGLLGPARKRQLELRHWHELTEDVTDRLFALLGTITHDILDRADTTAHLKEVRLYIKRHGWTISGKPDRYTLIGGLLDDYKTTSVYAIKDGEIKPEWVAQTNLYAHMLREHGYPADRLRIIAILRDWSKARAMTVKDYPGEPVKLIDVPLWSPERIEDFIYERLAAHATAQSELPECSPEERWQKPSVWIATRAGNIRPSKVEDTEAEIDAWIAEQTKGEWTKAHRRGEDTRCLYYCPCAPFCEQFKATRIVNKIGDLVA